MTQYLSQQRLLSMLIGAAVLGVLLGAVYSLFGIRRTAFRKMHVPRIASALLLHLEDFLFCIAGAVSLTVLYFATTNGVLRLMAIPALGVGFLCWRLTGGRLIQVCTDRILRCLARICRAIHRRVLAPIGVAVQKAIRRMRERYAARRKRRFLRKLTRAARKMTLRYEAALVSAAGKGSLPDLDGGRSRSVPKNVKKRKHTSKTKRNHQNEK